MSDIDQLLETLSEDLQKFVYVLSEADDELDMDNEFNLATSEEGDELIVSVGNRFTDNDMLIFGKLVHGVTSNHHGILVVKSEENGTTEYHVKVSEKPSNPQEYVLPVAAPLEIDGDEFIQINNLVGNLVEADAYDERFPRELPIAVIAKSYGIDTGEIAAEFGAEEQVINAYQEGLDSLLD